MTEASCICANAALNSLAICEECLFASAEAPEGATIEESQTALNGKSQNMVGQVKGFRY